MENRLIAAGYGRVSTLQQAQEGTSADDQRDRIQKYCQDKGWGLFKFYSDDGISGKTMEHRPGIQQLISDARSGKFNVVVFTKLDRLGRSNKDLINFCHLIQNECGLDLISLDMPFSDTKESFGKLMLAMMGGYSEFERDLIRERMSSGRQIRWANAKYGKAVIGALPYGYKWMRKKKEIVEHPKQGPVVKRIYSMYIDEGYSIKQITIKLTEDGIPTPSAEKYTKAKNKIAPRWNDYSVGKILKNEAYTGRVIQLNKFKRKTAVSKNTNRPYGYATNELRSEDEWLDARFPPLIAEDRWESAQKKRERNKIKPKRKHAGHEDHFLAENIIRCGECGGKMRRRFKNDSDNKRTIERYYYACCWQSCSRQDLTISGRDRCKLKSVDAEYVDAIIWEHVVRILSDPAKYAEQWFTDKDTEQLQTIINDLETKERIARNRSRSGYRNLTITNDPDLKSDFLAEFKKFESEYKELKDQRQRVEREMSSINNKIDILESFKEAMRREAETGGPWVSNDIRNYWNQIREYLGGLPFNERKRIVEAVVAPHNGGQVIIRYQRPSDYIDFGIDEEDLDAKGLQEPQKDKPKFIDTSFEVDLERVLAVISGLNKKDFYKKFEPAGTPWRLHHDGGWRRFQ